MTNHLEVTDLMAENARLRDAIDRALKVVGDPASGHKMMASRREAFAVYKLLKGAVNPSENRGNLNSHVPFNGTWLTENKGKKPLETKDAKMTDDAKPEQTAVNDSGTAPASDTRLARGRSPDVPRDLLVKRNLTEQSKWLNDDTGDRSWAVHPTQDIRWWMNVQVEALARGK